MKQVTAIASAVYFVTTAGVAAALIPAPSRHYESSEYEFSVEVPRGLHACVSDATDQGIDILLDHSLRCDRDYENEPFVDISASYNVAAKAITPKMLARVYCGYEKSDRTVQVTGWTLSGRVAAGCRQYFKDGRITVVIATQRKTAPRDLEAWIDISASLTTTAPRYDRDMRVFRKIVNTIRIAPDGPQK